jgi:hypothetical protein
MWASSYQPTADEIPTFKWRLGSSYFFPEARYRSLRGRRESRSGLTWSAGMFIQIGLITMKDVTKKRAPIRRLCNTKPINAQQYNLLTGKTTRRLL